MAYNEQIENDVPSPKRRQNNRLLLTARCLGQACNEPELEIYNDFSSKVQRSKKYLFGFSTLFLVSFFGKLQIFSPGYCYNSTNKRKSHVRT